METDWVSIITPPALMIIGGVITWFLKSRVEELRAAEDKIHQDRIKAYKEILSPFIQLLADVDKNQSRVIKEMTSLKYKQSSFELVLYGSDDVVKSWNDFMQHLYNQPGDDHDSLGIMNNFGRVLLEIRKSLGNKNTNLSEVDMLRWLLKDIDQILAEGKSVS